MNRRTIGDVTAFAVVAALVLAHGPWSRGDLTVLAAGVVGAGWTMARLWAGIVATLSRRAYAEGLQVGAADSQRTAAAREPAEPVGKVMPPAATPPAPTPRWSW